jgi:hypothetical protein
MGIQLYSNKEGNKQGKLRCGIYVYCIQPQAHCQYFDQGSVKRVSQDTCFAVFEQNTPLQTKKQPFYDNFFPAISMGYQIPRLADTGLN